MCKMIPQKIWDSQPAQRMDLYQRVDLAKPSKLMLKQMVLETVDEVNSRLNCYKKPLMYAWLLDGTRVKSFMDIHQKTKIIVVSRSKDFKGIKGLETLHGYSAF